MKIQILKHTETLQSKKWQTRGNLEEAERALETMEFRVAEMEPYIHNVFDLFLFIRNARGRINKRMPAYFS